MEKGKEILVGKGTDKGSPASIGHGNVPPDLVKNERNEILRRGVTLLSARQTVVLSLGQLRRLEFPDAGTGTANRERNEAVRTVLAALGLAAVALQYEQGYDLRLRCVLYAPDPVCFEYVEAQNGKFALTAETAVSLLSQGILEAERAGVFWRKGIVKFEPQEKLEQLYRKGLGAPSEDENESK